MNMKTKTVGKGVILLALILGMAFGFGVSQLFSAITKMPPPNHTAIIDVFTVSLDSFVLDKSYLSSGKSTWTLDILQENFLKGGTYTYSIWILSYQGDPEVYVCIWGPGKDGKTYQVEFANAWTRPYLIKWYTHSETLEHYTIIPIVVE